MLFDVVSNSTKRIKLTIKITELMWFSMHQCRSAKTLKRP